MADTQRDAPRWLPDTTPDPCPPNMVESDNLPPRETGSMPAAEEAVQIQEVRAIVLSKMAPTVALQLADVNGAAVAPRRYEQVVPIVRPAPAVIAPQARPSAAARRFYWLIPLATFGLGTVIGQIAALAREERMLGICTGVIALACGLLVLATVEWKNRLDASGVSDGSNKQAK